MVIPYIFEQMRPPIITARLDLERVLLVVKSSHPNKAYHFAAVVLSAVWIRRDVLTGSAYPRTRQHQQ